MPITPTNMIASEPMDTKLTALLQRGEKLREKEHNEMAPVVTVSLSALLRILK